MIEAALLFAAGVGGVAAGTVFFYGLWSTVRRLNRGPGAVALFLGSFILRFGMVLAGFYLLLRHGGWEHVLAATAGFTLARFFMLRRIKNVATPGESGA